MTSAYFKWPISPFEVKVSSANYHNCRDTKRPAGIITCETESFNDLGEKIRSNPDLLKEFEQTDKHSQRSRRISRGDRSQRELHCMVTESSNEYVTFPISYINAFRSESAARNTMNFFQSVFKGIFNVLQLLLNSNSSNKRGNDRKISSINHGFKRSGFLAIPIWLLLCICFTQLTTASSASASINRNRHVGTARRSRDRHAHTHASVRSYHGYMNADEDEPEYDIMEEVRPVLEENMRQLEAQEESKAASVAFPPIPHPKLPQYEIDALWDLYSQTNGPDWRWYDLNVTTGIPWNFTGNPNPCSPRWQGVICTLVPTGGYLHIVGMDLQMHKIHGPLPATFFNLTEMRAFSLATNSFTGTIPEAVNRMHAVRVIDFSNNGFTGPIPATLADCSDLHMLFLYHNSVNGTLPPELGTLHNLEILKVTLNLLTGTLPPSYGSLKNIRLLYLGRNSFVGAIPSEYGYLPNCTTLELDDNKLTGTIPSSIIHLYNVTNLYLDVNQFSGTIPDYLGQLSTLILLYLNNNKFTGTIPEALTDLPKLQNLYLHDNLLDGPIPSFLGTMSTLLALEINNNHFTGTIPVELTDLPALDILNLSGNYLTGSVIQELSDLGVLEVLDLSDNYLDGVIPPEIGRLNNLGNLYLYNNMLHGKLPYELGGLKAMVYLYLYGNMFTGPIPASFSNMSDLASLFLQDNRLSGNLGNVFNASSQRFLSTVQLSHNQITGTLTSDLFDLPLKTLALVTNCFSGAIPTFICSTKTLSTLSMDGLRAASSCQQVMLPSFISKAYVLTSKFSAGVPSCLFSMPNLITLHLSGNGLTGTLPADLNITDTLVDLSLSHNKITGTIPRAIQTRVWYHLDLSYNKFRGVLSKDFAIKNRTVSFNHHFDVIERNLSNKIDFSPSTLSLRNNRLSHTIPSVMVDMQNISILSGNLFSCELDERDLPAHDSGKDTYQCGSTSFDISYYLWLGSMFCVIVVLFVIYYWRLQLESKIGGIFIAITYLKRWMNVVSWYDQENIRSKSRLHNYKYVMKVCDAMGTAAIWTTLFILFVTLPVYSGASSEYGTHTYEYAWTVSAAFLSGYPALSVLLVFFVLLLATLLMLFRYRFRELRRFMHELPPDFHFSYLEDLEDFEEEKALEQSENKYSSWYEKAGIYFAFFMINFTIVMGVNIAYVYVVIYENSIYYTAAQIGLSIFKLGWNTLGSVYLIRWTHHYLASSATKEWKTKGAGFFAIQLFVALFNFIAIPCLVVAAVSPNCFNNMVVAAPSVSATYFYIECDVFSAHIGCLLYSPHSSTTEYLPPFTYSYECSSSIITYYAPSFVYMALLITFVGPVLEILQQIAHHHRPKGTWLAGQLDYWIAPVLKDLLAEDEDTRPPYDIYNPYFDANLLLVNVVTYFGVLITFGLVFPPLAIAILISMYVVIYTGKIEVGRFLTNAIDQNLHKYIDLVEIECQGVGSIPKLRHCVAMLLVFSCVFYTPFLFDTLGDSVGVDGAAWVVVVVPLFPLTIYMGHLTYIFVNKRHRQSKDSRRSGSVELRKSEFFKSKRAAAMLDDAMKMENAAEFQQGPSERTSDAGSDASEESDDAYTVNVLQKYSSSSNAVV